MTALHKHAAMIHAWADGAAVEARYAPEEEWEEVLTPQWDEECEFRIKLEVVRFRVGAFRSSCGAIETTTVDDSTDEACSERNEDFIGWLGDWQTAEVPA